MTRLAIVFCFLVTATQAAETTPSEILASVRIGKEGGCSGTIISKGEEVSYGISAAHCGVVVGQEFKIGFCDGSVGSARWKAVDQRRDVALFVCWSADILGYAPVPDGIIKDAALTGVGYPNTQGPKKVHLHYVKETNIGGGLNSRCQFNVVSGPYGGGASGGGVFRDGCLVSVFSHQNGSTTAFGCTHEDLFGFLKDNREKLLEGVVAVQCIDGKCPKDANGKWKPSPNVAIVLPKDERQSKDTFKDRAATAHILALEEKLAALEQRVANLEAGGKSDAPAPPLNEPIKEPPPAPVVTAGPKGDRGEQGPGPTMAQIRSAVEDWLAANKASLKGEPGPARTIQVVFRWSDGTPIASVDVPPEKTKVTQILERTKTTASK